MVAIKKPAEKPAEKKAHIKIALADASFVPDGENNIIKCMKLLLTTPKLLIHRSNDDLNDAVKIEIKKREEDPAVSAEGDYKETLMNLAADFLESYIFDKMKIGDVEKRHFFNNDLALFSTVEVKKMGEDDMLFFFGSVKNVIYMEKIGEQNDKIGEQHK